MNRDFVTQVLEFEYRAIGNEPIWPEPGIKFNTVASDIYPGNPKARQRYCENAEHNAKAPRIVCRTAYCADRDDSSDHDRNEEQSRSTNAPVGEFVPSDGFIWAQAQRMHQLSTLQNAVDLNVDRKQSYVQPHDERSAAL
jgi:hypothetical protein